MKRETIKVSKRLRKWEDELWSCRARGIEKGVKERRVNVKQ